MYLPHAVALLAWLLGWVLFFRLPRLPASEASPLRAPGPVTIVIPARNEAARIPPLLADLERERPPGARDAATGTLVFLDADVRLAPGALARVLATHGDGRGLTSVWPYHVVERAYEHLSALFNVVAWMGCGAASLVPAPRARAAFGPLLVTSVADYRAVGGHAAVRGHVVEDLALGRAYAALGLPVRVYAGSDDVAFRMYPDGLRALWNGWTRNQLVGALALPRWRVVAIGLWLVASVGLLTWARGIPTAPAWALYAAYAFQVGVFVRRVGSFSWWDGLLYPVHVVVYACVFVSSLLHALVGRRLGWRGRTLQLAGPRGGIGRIS